MIPGVRQAGHATRSGPGCAPCTSVGRDDRPATCSSTASPPQATSRSCDFSTTRWSCGGTRENPALSRPSHPSRTIGHLGSPTARSPKPVAARRWRAGSRRRERRARRASGAGGRIPAPRAGTPARVGRKPLAGVPPHGLNPARRRQRRPRLRCPTSGDTHPLLPTETVAQWPYSPFHRHIALFHRVEVKVVHVPRIIVLVADGISPETDVGWFAPAAITSIVCSAGP